MRLPVLASLALGASLAACSEDPAVYVDAEPAVDGPSDDVEPDAEPDAEPDPTAPDTQIDAGPAGAVASASAQFTFSSPDLGEAATFECAVDGAAFAACTSPVDLVDLADGEHAFEVRAVDAAGTVDPSPASRTWVVDTTAPLVAITDGPPEPTNLAAPPFSFTVSADAVAIECQLDGGASTPCASPFTPPALADGGHTLVVHAVDLAGNAGMATRAFTIDTVAPIATITAGPGLTTDTTPTFTFTTDGAPVAIRCRVDGGAYAACTSPRTVAAQPDGEHTFEVEVEDAAGNASSATRGFTVDTEPPPVEITDGPDGPVNDTTPTFAFSSEAGATFECRVDSGSSAACTPPFTTPTLGQGAHTFRVRAIDAAGNPSPELSRAFFVDTVAPVVTITQPENNELWAGENVEFRFTVSDATTVTRVCRVYEIGATPPAFVPCTPVWTVNVGGGDIRNMRFQVRVTDAVGLQTLRTRDFRQGIPAG